MKRSLSLAFVAVVFVQQLFAQSLEDGKKFMYYERFKSAKEVFEKLVAANPKNEEAAYWLGQAFIGLEDVAKAKQTYQAALQVNATSPLLMAGMGHVELLENNTTDARNHFDMAINNSKSKDNEVLHAVGRANAYTKAGDANYGIAQLQKITTTKKFNDPSVYVTIGDAYRKLVDGGNAVVAFRNALLLNPKYAAAKHKEGLIYESQKNKEYYLPAYEETIAMDPNYGPALYSLYFYWYFRDVAKAEDFLNKYIAAIDSDLQNDYYRIELKYVSGQFTEAISQSDALIAKVGADVIRPRIYRLKAYSYYKLGDMANAKASIDEFFKKAKPEDIVPKDYDLIGDIFAGTKGSEALAFANYEKAMDADTVQDNKASYLDKAVALAKKLGDKPATAYWLDKQYKAKKSPSNVDMYNLGRAFFDAGASGDFAFYSKADSVFVVYTEKYPDQAYGYYWRARSNWSIDTSMVNGMANPHFEKFVQVASASKDSASFRPQIKLAYKYFVGYNIFVKKDYKVAIEFCDKILAIDPADKEALEYKRQLTGGKSQTTGSTTAKPGATGSGTATSSGTGGSVKN